MAAYRMAIKEHFESIPRWKTILDSAAIFWGVGLGLYVLGGCLVVALMGIGALLNSIGLWMAIFGLVAAFIKQDERGLVVTTGGLALFNLIFFIIFLARSGMGDFSLLISMLVFGSLFMIAYRSSGIKKNIEMKRAQEASIRAQQMQQMQAQQMQMQQMQAQAQQAQPIGRPGQAPQMWAAGTAPGAVCVSCGAALIDGAVFCNKCGAKQPEQQEAQAATAASGAVCVSCGAELIDGAVFCNKCGAKQP